MVEIEIPQNPFLKCNKQLECGHACNGVIGESECCLPCLETECNQTIDVITTSSDETDLCGICFTSELGEEPCIILNCGHIFHANCLLMLMNHRWTTTKMTFGYLDCPSCKQEIKLSYYVQILTSKIREQFRLKTKIIELSTQKAIEEGYDKEGRVVTEGDIYYGKLAEYALHQCTFYECFKCKQPFFGGMQDCAQAL